MLIVHGLSSNRRHSCNLPSCLFSSLVSSDGGIPGERRIYAVRWGNGSEHMSDAVVNDSMFLLHRTSAGLSKTSIYPTSSHFVEHVPIHGSVDIDITIRTSFRYGWLFN